MGQLLDLLSDARHIDPVALQLLPNNLKAPLGPFAEDLGTGLKTWVILVQTVVGEVDIGVAEILFGGCLVVLDAEASEPFFVEIANIGGD